MKNKFHKSRIELYHFISRVNCQEHFSWLPVALFLYGLQWPILVKYMKAIPADCTKFTPWVTTFALPWFPTAPPPMWGMSPNLLPTLELSKFGLFKVYKMILYDGLALYSFKLHFCYHLTVCAFFSVNWIFPHSVYFYRDFLIGSWITLSVVNNDW